jgi:hypothetical protein
MEIIAKKETCGRCLLSSFAEEGYLDMRRHFEEPTKVP